MKGRKGKVAMTQDEHPRPQTTLEQMAKLAPVFKKGGTVTAANASVSNQPEICNKFDKFLKFDRNKTQFPAFVQ